MGSAGAGRLSDFPGGSGGGKPPSGMGSGGGSLGGAGDGGPDKCSKAIDQMILEDVEISDYYEEEQKVPPKNFNVKISSDLKEGRIAIEGTDGRSIGFAPSEFNYLRRCMAKGFTYSGAVVSSTGKPHYEVIVKLEAISE